MPPFRVHSVVAKGVRERYGIGPETQDQFNACLAQSKFDPDHPLSVSIREARGYLDVCFLHPFDEGNARAAFLAALFVLAREGSCWKALGPCACSAFTPLTLRTRRGWPVTSKPSWHFIPGDRGPARGSVGPG
jgi:hypothetical protein